MPSLSSIARRLSDRAFGTAFDRTLERAARDPRNAFLFFWNRGLGDIALGLVPLFDRLRARRPDARIVVVTREELRIPFEMTSVDEVLVVPGLPREQRLAREALRALRLDAGAFAAVFAYPDPNRWLEGRRREFPPRLRWKPEWDACAGELPATKPGTIDVGVHVSSETARYYGYRKDWPAESWQALFDRLGGEPPLRWVLLGYEAQAAYRARELVDLRGRTDFPTLMSLVRNRLRVLVAPDSGVLTMAYYVDAPFAIDVISLWADPRRGVLRQDCPSPNPRLVHTPLFSPGEDIRNLRVEAVEAALRSRLAALDD